MTKEVINIPGAPDLPFSSGIKVADYIFVSGQVGSRDAEGNEVTGIEAQTRQCLENVKKVLAAAGASLDDVVKATVFLKNQEEFGKMNEVYRSYFQKDKPARSTAIAGLVLPNMLVEIECIAYHPAGG
jgi:2-iminobutanoate/2-iminopropanoate deaminase